MKHVVFGTCIALCAASSAYALEVNFSGFSKTKYSIVNNNLADADSLGTTACSKAAVVAEKFCDDSDGFSSDAELRVDAIGSSALFPQYGGHVAFINSVKDDNEIVKVDTAEIFAVTSFGRFGFGKTKISNLSADRISAGESGVSSDPLGREYESVFGGPAITYGIALGGFRGGLSVNDAGELSGTVFYAGTTASGLNYDVFARGGSRGVVNVPVAGVDKQGASSFDSEQIGGKVSFGNWSLAASHGTETVTESELLGAKPNLGDISRDYNNIAVAYSSGNWSVSADYDEGTIEAPWTTQAGLNGAGAWAGMGPMSEREWDAYSVGASYKIAPGLTFGIGHKVYNNALHLNLEPTMLSPITGLTGATLKNRTETAASLKLAF